jgi:hypothetical protein
MSLLSLAAGIAIGAAFTPFWNKVWTWIKGEATTVEADVKSVETKVSSVVSPAPTVTPTVTK